MLLCLLSDVVFEQDSQKDLSNKTSETFSQVVEGSDRAIKIQTELSVKQSSLKEAITDNIQKLSQEKRMIESRHKDIHKHSTEVKKDLGRNHVSM